MALSLSFKGIIIINKGLTPETAEKATSSGIAHLASFGKNFINNPDFVERIQNGWEGIKTFDFNVPVSLVMGKKVFLIFLSILINLLLFQLMRENKQRSFMINRNLCFE